MRTKECNIKWMRKDVLEKEGWSWFEAIIYDWTPRGYDVCDTVGEGILVYNADIPKIMEWLKLITQKEEVVIGVCALPASYDQLNSNNSFGIENAIMIGKSSEKSLLAFLNLDVVPEEDCTEEWLKITGMNEV